ncbi:MAG: acyl-CoA dehydrogenase family protein, partial [Paracoccaceae bacterium]
MRQTGSAEPRRLAAAVIGAAIAAMVIAVAHFRLAGEPAGGTRMIPGELSAEQQAIRDAIGRLMEPFDDAYWLERDASGIFPHAFRRAVAAGGWLGIAMPEQYGGSGLGVAEAAVMMEAVANSPGAMAAASAVHMNIFGPLAIVRHGTPEQKAEWLAPIIRGDLVTCFGVTEPDA